MANKKNIQKNRNNFDPLAKSKNTHLLEELLEWIPETRLANLKIAIGIPNVPMVSWLLESNKIDLKQKEYNDLLVRLLKDPRHLLPDIFDIACLLLNAGASTKRPALHFAVENGHTSVVKELLKRGVDFDEMRTKTRDETPLMIAGRKGYFKIIKILCAYGARDNILNREGNNALTITIHSLDCLSPIGLEDKPDHKKSIELLCKNGSDLNVKPRSNENMTPLQSAEEYSHTTVADLLRRIAQIRKDREGEEEEEEEEEGEEEEEEEEQEEEEEEEEEEQEEEEEEEEENNTKLKTNC